MEPPLDLERFATLSAELTAGTQRDELCAREGISLADWNASQETWLGRLADETAGKRFVLTNRYNNAFVARRRALTHGPRFPAQKPVAARKAEPAAPPPVEVAPPPVMVSLPAFAAGPPPIYREPETPPPSFRAPDPAPPVYREPEPPPRRHVKAATEALPAFTEPATAALPFAPTPSVVGTTESPTEVGASPFAQPRGALPFKPAGPAAPSPALPLATLAADDLDDEEDPLESATVKGTSPFAASAPALPFQPAPAVTATAPAPPVPVRRPSAPPPRLDGGSTVYGAISPFAAQPPALPFQAAAPPARGSSPQSNAGLPFQPTAAPAPSAPVAAPRPVASAPVATPRPVASAPVATPRPAPAPAPVPAPVPAPIAAVAARLTLEQFASLTAEIAVNPRGVAQIRARYGFDEASHRAEAEEHNRRFTADPALYARYMELFQAYREYVARAPR